MANTLINGEIIARIIDEKMVGKAKLMGLATSLGDLDNGVQAGDTYSIIKFKHLDDAVDLVKGEAIPVEDVQATKTSETIEHKAKGVNVYDIEKETTIGGKSIEDKVADNMASIFVKAVEVSLGEKLVKAPVKFATAGALAITADEINQALTTAFGDNQDTSDFSTGGIVINSRLAPAFYAMPEFVDAGKTYTAQGNGIVQAGVIGYFRGIKVVMSDIATYDTTKSECVSFILKNDVVGYKKVKVENIETQRNAQFKRDEIFGDLMFVTGIVDDTGIVVMRKTIA